MTAFAPIALATALLATAVGAPVSESASLAQTGLAEVGADAAMPLASCDNVTINVKNGKSVKIKALKIEYKSVEDGKWRDEGFNNEEINPGATDTVKSGAKLEHIEGQIMQSIKLHYKMWCGGKWSVTYTTTDSSFSDAKCVYGKTYRVDVPSGGC